LSVLLLSLFFLSPFANAGTQAGSGPKEEKESVCVRVRVCLCTQAHA